MTEMVRSALVLAGADMENFNAENPRESEKSLMRSAACLEMTLGEKYPDTEFEITACVRQSLAQRYDEFTVASKEYPDETFIARIWSDETGLRCSDGYYGLMRRGDYEAMISDELKEAEPVVNVISTIDYLCDESCGAAVPIEEAVAQPGFFSFTWILVPENGTALEERAEKVWSIIEEKQLAGDFALYSMLGEWKMITREESFTLIPSHSESQPVYADVVRLIRR